jgi:hypothetical protein
VVQGECQEVGAIPSSSFLLPFSVFRQSADLITHFRGSGSGDNSCLGVENVDPIVLDAGGPAALYGPTGTAQKKSGVPVGALAGGVVGAFLAGLLAAFLAAWLLYKRDKKKKDIRIVSLGVPSTSWTSLWF